MSGTSYGELSKSARRRRARESERQVGGILMRWDPIGVADEPRAADEYDCMIGPILTRLRYGNPADQLDNWLLAEVEDHFGLPADTVWEAELANELRNWWRDRSVGTTI